MPGKFAKQDPQPWEIIISDDSDEEHEEGTCAVAKEFGARYIRGPRRGLYANRNAAALACVGTHIRTMDDDHTFPERHMGLCMEAVKREPRAIWTCGERGLVDGRLQAFSERATQLHPSGVGCAVSDPDNNWAVADGATIYPRGVFDDGFRFVEEFGFGSSYLEFGALLYSRGWRSRCIPGAFVEHHASEATVHRHAPMSCLFASLCYNLRFQPNLVRLTRYAAPYARHFRAVPAMLRKINARWTT